LTAEIENTDNENMDSENTDSDLGAAVHDHCVVGAGIVGLAVARQLLLREPGASVVVVDKEPVVAAHQTGHNSGVIHAGIYYKPGSVKSVLCQRGVGLLEEFCDEHGVAYDVCGKLIVAVDPSEVPALERLQERSLEAGVPGITRVGPAEVRDIEPNAVACDALHSPTTAIVDFRAVAVAIADEITRLGGRIVLNAAVRRIEERGDVVTLDTERGQVRARRVVTCAGLQSDAVAEMAKAPASPRIVPFRGEYYHLRPDRTHLVRGLLYPVPDPRYPFLGVHFTKMIDGGVTVGPNAVLALAREGYRWRDISARDLARLAAWPGTWRMAKTHWRTGVNEVVGSVSKQVFLKRAQHYLPMLESADLGATGSGVRAQAVDRSGALLDDFAFSSSGRVLSVRNAPSPAATASIAIAERVVDELGQL
jgi:L-2-hydroxyglutarate oxidase